MRRWQGRLLLILLLSGGCGDEDEDDRSTSDADVLDAADASPPDRASVCQARDERTCTGEIGCSPYRAATVEEHCRGDTAAAVFVGCGPAERLCGALITYATDPRTGRQMVFSSTCLPPGWSMSTSPSPCDHDAGASDVRDAVDTSNSCQPGDRPPGGVVCPEDELCYLPGRSSACSVVCQRGGCYSCFQLRWQYSIIDCTEYDAGAP